MGCAFLLKILFVPLGRGGRLARFYWMSPPPPPHTRSLKTWDLREVRGKIRMSKNLETKICETEDLGRHDLSPSNRHGFAHDRATSIAQTRSDVTGAVWKHRRKRGFVTFSFSAPYLGNQN